MDELSVYACDPRAQSLRQNCSGPSPKVHIMTSLPPASAIPQALGLLLQTLDLEVMSDRQFRGISPQNGWGRIYGGQVLGQGLQAAHHTVDETRLIHSMHGYFLLPGNPTVDIVYDVERLRDGASFATRRVTAIQEERPIFEMIASFHREEPGFEHAEAMPNVPPPEAVPTLVETLNRSESTASKAMRSYYVQEQPVEVRLVDADRYLGGTNRTPKQHMWIKATAPLPDQRALHSAILAYASDFALIDTALIAHGRTMFEPQLQLASLDHACWIHRPFRIDDWLLYALDSPVAGRGRGLARGSFFTRDGQLVASVAQEGLMRERSTAYLIK